MRYILGFLIGIGLIILLFVLIFRGGNNSTPVPKPLVDYAVTDTTMEYTDDYPVNLDQVHEQVLTVVGRDQVTVTVYQGYQGTVLQTKSYANNPTAYANFLRSLDLAGYNSGKTDQNLKDERGYCPLGHRYIFTIKNGNSTIQHLWSTSCGNIGNFQGKTGTVRSLFQAQVPDYAKITSDATNAISANAAATASGTATPSVASTGGPF